jgi:hypothetical protein
MGGACDTWWDHWSSFSQICFEVDEMLHDLLWGGMEWSLFCPDPRVNIWLCQKRVKDLWIKESWSNYLMAVCVWERGNEWSVGDGWKKTLLAPLLWFLNFVWCACLCVPSLENKYNLTLQKVNREEKGDQVFFFLLVFYSQSLDGCCYPIPAPDPSLCHLCDGAVSMLGFVIIFPGSIAHLLWYHLLVPLFLF